MAHNRTMYSESERRLRFESIAAEVYEPLQRFLGRRAPADEAEEAFSETLLTIWRRIDDVPTEAVLPWSYGVARRVLSNRFRGARRRRSLDERIVMMEPPRIEPDPAAVDDHPELAAALAALRDEDREVLRLWAWEQLEPREMAVVLGISDNATAQRLSKAKQRLAKQMTGQDSAPGGHRGDEHIGDRS
jgi:RNA polymerase sigma-70 factor (ECF subfamily)